MAKYAMNVSSAFTNWQDIDLPGLTVRQRSDLTIAHFCAASGKQQLVRAAIQGAYVGALPSKPQRVVMDRGVEFIWTGLDQWLAVAPREAGRDLEHELRSVLRGLASVTDQSDARAVVRVSGRRSRELLARGVPIDLDPRVFPANGAAITHASHIGVVLWQIGKEPEYDVAVFRSFADSLAGWLHHSLAGLSNAALVAHE